MARHALEEALGELGTYVNLIAKGDATIVEASGFPSYDTARTPDTAPTDVRLRQGGFERLIGGALSGQPSE